MIKEFKLRRGKGKDKGRVLLDVICNDGKTYQFNCSSWKQAYLAMDFVADQMEENTTSCYR